MSTNANIMMKNDDGSVDVIYDYWDGDLDSLGRKLDGYYRDDSKVRQLIDLGNVSTVGVVTDASPLVQRFGFDAIDNSPEVESVVGDLLDTAEDSPKGKVFESLMFTEYYFTTAYHRDRGWDLSIDHYDNEDQVPLLEFNYVYIKGDGDFGHWLVKDEREDRFHSLTDALSSHAKDQ